MVFCVSLAGLVLSACGKSPPGITPAEEGALEMPASDPHRFYVLNPLWIAPATQMFAVDGANEKFLALMDGGYMARAAFSAARHASWAGVAAVSSRDGAPVADEALDLPLRGDADFLQELSDLDVEPVFVHGRS